MEKKHSPAAYLQVGVITSPHALRGEVNVFPTTDDVTRFRELKEVLLDTGKGKIPMEIEGVKFVKRFVILKLKGIDHIDEAEKYRRKALYVSRENAVSLERDEYFIADLEGLRIQDEEGREIGTLRSVLQTGANDVYVIDLSDGRELLLPALKQCILGVHIQEGWMKVHILDGLLEDRKG
ncbi:MAG: ribosome maturation factor RimM [Clostridium sp.]|jgi:16S rRNA processing protein RimM|nr:ribosome maturation factor RimM [Clostridium sp.]